MNQNVLVTGATGFVGRAVCQHLKNSGFEVRKALRKLPEAEMPESAQVVGDINGNTDWSQALAGVDSIVHLAARVHVMNDAAADPLSEFRKINVDGTVNLAQQAAKANIRRFVFISSIKVNGEKTEGKNFTENDVPAPQDPYGISKLEAEQALQEIARQTGLEIVILRPPLMYGPRVKANFYSLMNTIYRGWPLPLGSIQNQRSLLYVDTFADAIKACLLHPNANGKTYLVSDNESVSTSDLVTRLGYFLQRSPRLLNVPVSWMKLGAKCLGKGAVVDRLTSSLVVDSSKIRRELNWSSPYSFDLGIQKTTEWFLTSKSQ
ncbi:MAG: SDR family oxidoreductase [Acidobacteria bacterium]|nr:SDR family oxidoreductase [Acidobacteriota bacterium]